MDRYIFKPKRVACVAAALVIIPGCAKETFSESTHIRQTTWRANLDDYRAVQLSYDLIKDRKTGQPDRRYEQLTLAVLPREHLRFERALKTIELTGGVSRGQLKFQNVAIRTDPSRQRVWFVDRDTNQIIATFDKATLAATGPDDTPPDWATPDGGVPLRPSK